jgi:hypothetical protein
VLAVREGTLVAVLGRHATDSLAAMGLRRRTGAGAAVPGASLAAALAVSRSRTELTYGAAREGAGLRGTLRLRAPDEALRALQAVLAEAFRPSLPFLR